MIIITDILAFYKRICIFFPEKLFLFKTPTRSAHPLCAKPFTLPSLSPLGGLTNKILAKYDIRDFLIVIFLSFRC